MPKSADCWGIEVGANALKAIRLRRSGNEVRVADFDVIPFKKVLTTPDLDVEEAIRVNLDQFLLKHDVKRSNVAVAVPGHMAFARFAKLPPVEPRKIPDIVKFEAVQQIPFPIDEVEWDYQTFQDPDSPDVEVGIFAITKTRLHPWLEHFRAMGIPVHQIVLSPVAVYNALSYDMDLAGESRGTILLDIGTQATDLIITEGSRVWLRTIPLGGNHFTEALVKSFKLSFSKAEKLKREAATSKYARQIFQAMRPVFVDLVQEVQKSLGYYQSLNRDADLQRLIGLGSTFRLPGLQTFLKQQLQLEIQRLDQFQKIEAEGREASTFAENALGLAPAYGLALQGLGMERVSCNLLPRPVVRQQVWKAKNKWFAASAAVVIGGVGLAYGSLAWTKATYNTAENAQYRRQVSQIVERASGAWQKWEEGWQQNDPRPKIANLNRMLDMRTLWPSIVRDIDQALMAVDPQPALMDGNAEQIEQIPRSELRYVGLTRLTASYRYERGSDGDGRDGGEDGSKSPWSGGSEPPRYRITLTGFTPYNTEQESAADFIENRFNRQLIEDANNPNRPYFIPEPYDRTVKISSINEIKGEGDSGTGGGDGGDVGPAYGGGEFGFGFEGGPPPEAQPDEPQTQEQTQEFKPILEPKAGDRRFVIEWMIELRDPGEMRLGEAVEPIKHADTSDPNGENQP